MAIGGSPMIRWVTKESPMSTYTATIRWVRKPDERFTDGKYSRAHEWAFDGGAVVPASSSPSVVRVPFSDPAGVDPEEALAASLSSCHMLFFRSFSISPNRPASSSRPTKTLRRA